MDFNKQYMIGAAMGGFVGFFVSTQALMHPRQSIWLILFGGTAGYAISESRDLRKQLEGGIKNDPDELSQMVTELRGMLSEAKQLNSGSDDGDRTNL